MATVDLSNLNDVLFVANNDGTVDMYGRQGKIWEFKLVLFQDEYMKTPMDLTGYGARGQIRKSYGTDVVKEFTCSIQDPLSGVIHITLSAVDTAEIPCGKRYFDSASKYVYDIEIYELNDTSVVHHGIGGTLYVFAEVTT